MARIEVQKVPGQKDKVRSKRQIYAEICLNYPQYSLKKASKLSARDIELLLTEAHKMEAIRFYNLTLITNSPNSKKGEAAKRLLKHFKEIIDG